MAKQAERGVSSGRHKPAEAELPDNGAPLCDGSPEKMSELVHELQRRQIEIELQNEELRKTQAELAESHEQYASLYDFAPVGYATVSGEGIVLQANLRLAEMLGVHRSQLVGRSLCAFVVAEDAENYDRHWRERSPSRAQTICEIRMKRSHDRTFWAAIDCVVCPSSGGAETTVRCTVSDITERKQAEEEMRRKQAEEGLRRMEWMLTPRRHAPESGGGGNGTDYGDLTELNTCREILDSVGSDALRDIAGDYLDLLQTSSAIYERNGDYAQGIFASGWCQFLDKASRDLCHTNDNREALSCGKWLCHESCWGEASRTAMATGRPADIECSGGIRLYAAPIRAGDEIIGAINFGYGDPPTDAARIAELAERYQVDPEELRTKAEEYESRPKFIVETAKRRLAGSARLIGEMVTRHRSVVALRESQEALRKERDFAESLVETANAIVLVLDSQGRIVRFNRHLEKLSGYQLADVKGKDWFTTFLPGKDNGRIRELFRQSIRDIPAHGNVNPILTKDGQLRDIEWYDHALRDVHGEVIGLLSVGQDVTERKRSEEMILRQQYYLEKAQELGQIGTWELDLRQNKLYWTDENCRIFGVPPGSIVTYEVFLGRVHPDDREYVNREWIAALDGKAYDIEHRLDIDGTIRWVREKAEVEFDEAGEAVKAIGFTQDITERRETQRALRESQEELAEIFSLSLDLICICDINEAKFLKVNPAFTRVLGYAEAELVNHPFSEFIHPDDRDATRKVTEHELRRGTELVGFENRYRCKDGTWRWLEWTSHPQPERGIAFGVAHDITERRQREERLRQAEKMEAIGQLAGGVAHDFNNQLGGIMNYADLLLTKIDDEELRPFVDGIIRLCTRSGELTRQLLAFSRKGQYQVVPVNMHQIVGEVVSLLGRSIDRRIQIRQRLDANPPTTTGDPAQLQNALLNLALNARDAMPQGGDLVFATDIVTLDRERCSNSRLGLLPGEYVRIKVIDSGTGMDVKTQAKIFEPFFTTKEQGKGTGMGLPSVYGTVVNHRGAIEVESEIGAGTNMTVYLPLLREEPPKANGSGNVAGQNEAESASARILVVDDEESVRECTARMLRHKGYSAVTCKDGAEAVDYYGKSWQHIDLVILDMNMPVLNGRDTFIAMREINPDIRAMLATGYSLDSDAQEILDEGVLSHIQKPFRMHELFAQVEQALGG